MLDNFEKYRQQNGAIRRKEYWSILARAKDAIPAEPSSSMRQGLSIAKYAGIAVQDTWNGYDVVTVYCLMRRDKRPKEKKDEFHYSQMSDQRLFAEALKILGDTDSLNRLMGSYQNISFD